VTLRERLAQFEEFNRWEAEHPRSERSFEATLADLSCLLSLIPPERRVDPDPEKLGLQEFQRAMARIGEYLAKR
jgi:hypothetical protein